MASIPITVARQKYIEEICSITNKSGLPAFVIADVLERTLIEVKGLSQKELSRDMAQYQAQLAAEGQPSESFRHLS